MTIFTSSRCPAIAVLFLLAASALGETRYVSIEGAAESPFTSLETAARDIASALDVAADGDEIVVAPGTYPTGRTIVVNRAVTVRSAAGARKTVLDGCGRSGVEWCFEVQSGRAIVDGFTITRFGGGVRFSHGEGTSAVVRDCLIVRNAGHGVFFNHGGCAKNCTVAYNGGAGLYAYDMGGGGDDPANLILFGNEQGFVRQSANISLQNSCTDDPHFVSDNDFRLRPDSPCIDAGRNEDWMIGAVDAAGRPRIQNKVADVGAYEFEPVKPPTNEPLTSTGPVKTPAAPVPSAAAKPKEPLVVRDFDEAVAAQPKLLKISCRLDGSGRIIFTPGSVRYQHKHWRPPNHVLFDGEPWTQLGKTPAPWHDYGKRLDLSKAWIVQRQGRDVVALEPTSDGFDLYLCDSPNGGADYAVTIAVPRRR